MLVLFSVCSNLASACLDLFPGQLVSGLSHSYLTDIASVASVKGELKSSPVFIVSALQQPRKAGFLKNPCFSSAYKNSQIITEIHMFTTAELL